MHLNELVLMNVVVYGNSQALFSHKEEFFEGSNLIFVILLSYVEIDLQCLSFCDAPQPLHFNLVFITVDCESL